MLLVSQITSWQRSVLYESVSSGGRLSFSRDWHCHCKQLHFVSSSPCRTSWCWRSQASIEVFNYQLQGGIYEAAGTSGRIWTASSILTSTLATWRLCLQITFHFFEFKRNCRLLTTKNKLDMHCTREKSVSQYGTANNIPFFHQTQWFRNTLWLLLFS